MLKKNSVRALGEIGESVHVEDLAYVGLFLLIFRNFL